MQRRKASTAIRSGSVGYVAILQTVTIGWMLIECGGSLFAAAKARSLPMAAFGADSFVELLSAVVVILQFGTRLHIRRPMAARIAGGLLFLLSGIAAVLAQLAARRKVVPERSYLGIGITLGALVIMPVLAILKRRHASTTQDHALAADAVQSATCAYLAAITLVSLLLQVIHPLWWIDPIAVACLIPLLLLEGLRAWRGACGCG